MLGADMRRSKSLPPAAVTVRSIVPSKDPCFVPLLIDFVNSRFRLVAASICILSSFNSTRGGLSIGNFPFWVASKYSANAPSAETCDRLNPPNASKEETEKSVFNRSSPEVLSNADLPRCVTVAPLSFIASTTFPFTSSTMRTSEGVNRANSARKSSTLFRDKTLIKPVEMSTHAKLCSSLINEYAAKKLFDLASKRLSSVNVPGVTSLTTSRFTTDFEPLFFASAGLSNCSHTATL